ncbi:hypothetical protein ACIQCJ_17090 [Streptomyces sp. NPDC093221]|uniref:hypothetical protein n=1 Tax=Streptomyces sp. NPDC093221 TaxID=3366032 RepID=UPI003827413B
MMIFIIITFIAAVFLIIQGSNEEGAGGVAFICVGIVTLAAAGTLTYLMLRGPRRE